MSASHIHAINCIEVPHGHEDAALQVRETYVDYFRRQPGFVSACFYRATTTKDAINFINIVVWESQDAYNNVVNAGFDNADGVNADGMKVLGKGFPAPIVVHPGVFEIVAR